MTQMLRPFNEQYVFNFIIIKSIVGGLCNELNTFSMYSIER